MAKIKRKKRIRRDLWTKGTRVGSVKTKYRLWFVRLACLVSNKLGHDTEWQFMANACMVVTFGNADSVKRIFRVFCVPLK